MFKPRPKQQDVLSYEGGTMGVSAVPGSGKTFTLSYLAAKLVAESVFEDDQEVLIVTLVNSAVDNFKQRVGSFIQEMNLLPNVGYRVRTLHGLAHDIVRERPGLVGLSDDFQIVDESEANHIRNRVFDAWLQSRPGELVDDYMSQDLLEKKGKSDWVRRDKWPDLARQIADVLIRRAKDLRLGPEDLTSILGNIPLPLPLLEMGVEIYNGYQRALAFHGALDFSDLIRYAIRALELDEGYLDRLRNRWPYILEDEAQDSSLLQEKILRMLSGRGGNWVRVGDPNQAIFETFTPASPELLRKFIDEAANPRELPNSGRSTQSIIDLANYLIQWTREKHDVLELRESLSEPYILPAPPDDPQPNPPDHLTHIEFVDTAFDQEQEITCVVESLAAWLPENKDKTVAVLVPTNNIGVKVAEALRERCIDYIDILRTTTSTRRTTGSIANVLNYLADPQNPRKLSTAFQVWRREDREDEESSQRLKITSKIIQKIPRAEDFVWPRSGRNWEEALNAPLKDELTREQLNEFRGYVQRWHLAAVLPVDQLILTIGQDLFHDPSDLALTHKLATILKQVSTAQPGWRLPEFVNELAVIAKNRRNFIGFSDDDINFEPERMKGKVVVITMHKAKGLEWDRVYLVAVNNYWFPSAHPDDHYPGERFFIRDHLDLTAEALAQLDAAIDHDPHDWYVEGVASERARFESASESLRVLYVGITRAREELIVTYNQGYKNLSHASLPFTVLRTYLEEKDSHVAR